MLSEFSECNEKIAQGTLRIRSNGECRHLECFEIPTSMEPEYNSNAEFLMQKVQDESDDRVLDSQDGIDSIAEKMGSVLTKNITKKKRKNASSDKAAKKTPMDIDSKDVELAEKLAMFIHRLKEFPEKYFSDYGLDDDLDDLNFWAWEGKIRKYEDLEGKKRQILLDFENKDARSGAKKTWKKIVSYTGSMYLHMLDDKVQTKEEIRALVQCVPEALSWYSDLASQMDCYFLPIHSAILCVEGDLEDIGFHINALSFVPLLLEEGIKHDIPLGFRTTRKKVGGLYMTLYVERITDIETDTRGGLLSKFEIEDGRSTFLQSLARFDCNFGWQDKDSQITSDEMMQASVVKTFETLKQMNLISKEDILNHDLIPTAAKHRRFGILEWLAALCPDGLKTYFGDMETFSSRPFMHGCASKTIDHYYGHEEYYNEKEFPLDRILDVTFRHFPDELGLLFLQDGYDDHEETTLSIAYECRGEKEVWNSIVSAMEKVDPFKLVSFNEDIGMFPFMHAARDETADLNLVYHLMRKDPVLWNTGALKKTLKDKAEVD